MKELKAAVIGVGSMGQHHARVYTEIPKTELVGVADSLHENGQRIASKYGVPAFDDYHEMLSAVRPDVVTIAVPTSLHREVAETAMAAGAHVLIEKPIAASIEDAEALIRFANEHKKQLMVGHIVRFNPAIQELKNQLDAGVLGRLFQITCRRIGPFPTRINDVGVVIDLAPHDLDIMRFISDDEPVRLYAETEQQIHTAHEDTLAALLRFKSGFTGVLEIDWLTPTKVREILVHGERGMFRVDDLTQDLYFYENSYANGETWDVLGILRGVSEGKMIRYAIKRYEPLRAELEAFSTAVLENRQVPVTGEDGIAALRLALALVKSGLNNEVVKIPA